MMEHRLHILMLIGAGDVNDRKSTSGYIFMMSRAAVSWKSKKANLCSSLHS